ncbi:MAG: 3-methyl-2-oxobutanoate hydroxymethyltransferase [Ruminococcus sp.]|nr:3-methyl-2-oxobutanoate hydroxymethyltransferase [Ruminococcus sp.]
MKNTVSTLMQQKQSGDKITMLTAYDYTTAKIIDECGVNAILIGDSLGMVMLGYENTLPVTMEDMIHHTAAVSRAAENAFVVADMPFLSYQISVQEAVANAGRLIKEGGAHAVKLEGGAEVCEQIRAIVNASIPVVAHLGLTPQSVNVFGGFKVQGKSLDKAEKLISDALLIQEAGACAVVLEGIPAKLAEIITKKLMIPTIGIGAGSGCDGQVLVYQDMLGLTTGHTPKFVKRFAEVGELMRKGITDYISETKSGEFPAQEHTYAIDEDVISQIIKECE